ncbi:CWC16 protein [Aspergillus floccosus]
MSERKVLTKYYPPDFDPSAITRQKKPKDAAPRLQTVRLMAPYSMKCTHCGEYIYKGRKFNARKETTEEKYFSIPIYRFYIRCTRCSGEITFKTDPKNMDYRAEKGAKRNFEPWRNPEAETYNETEQETLDRLEREENEEQERLERDKMEELEEKMLDSKREMAIADALDEIRTRNARIERNEARGDEALAVVRDQVDEARLQQEKEDEEAARRAFMTESGERVKRLVVEEGSSNGSATPEPKTESPAPPPSFTRVKKAKKPPVNSLGIKKKAKPSLV